MREILFFEKPITDFPNLRSIYARGIMITDEPITCFVALDILPKNFQTVQFDMYSAEDAGFEKVDFEPARETYKRC